MWRTERKVGAVVGEGWFVAVVACVVEVWQPCRLQGASVCFASALGHLINSGVEIRPLDHSTLTGHSKAALNF